MGTLALYALLYCVFTPASNTTMTYNLTSAIFIALFSFLLFKNYHGPVVLLAVVIGFLGMLLVYKPNMHYPGTTMPWAFFWHVAPLPSLLVDGTIL
jgi:drug/metabolite transporter (DMT)-like permease